MYEICSFFMSYADGKTGVDAFSLADTGGRKFPAGAGKERIPNW